MSTKKARQTAQETPNSKGKKASTPAQPSAEAKPTKLSALDAAAKILAEMKESLTCPELIAQMATKGYWTSPQGKTPSATLYSALTREIKTKGDKARFQKTDRGKFSLAQD